MKISLILYLSSGHFCVPAATFVVQQPFRGIWGLIRACLTVCFRILRVGVSLGTNFQRNPSNLKFFHCFRTIGYCVGGGVIRGGELGIGSPSRVGDQG